ncbi:helix-turn-helix domain-containing protein [Hafnia alvei]|uniref:helix-turn-helix domain-containing protein n=1 Tax=Hafnia alvei TaxID=569 RepID=UPI000C9F37A4|nr:helix-turn-helix transcriptional regulator [Hafnia alvei]MBI0276285.1 helix-turn-helix domain-containing protein [Hafnia alvei]PNK97186.1 transcriptional regulator [Hafnia alvei]
MQETDWHKADILAALKKKKISVAYLSRSYGLADGTLLNALNKKWPRGELIIANAIGLTPQEIWPSRYYDQNGLLMKKSIRKPI